MANITKEAFLKDLGRRYGNVRKLKHSLSLYDIGKGAGRIYIRYSKLHSRGQTFFGLRQNDLKILEGQPALICFLWPNQREPLFLPFTDFEDVFHSISPAGDGQYKVQIFLKEDGCELYIANAGRFNIEAYFGWDNLEFLITKSKLTYLPSLSHFQIQTLLGSIGITKGYDVWIPKQDRGKMDWNLTKQFECNTEIPLGYSTIEDILREIDIIWFDRGAGTLRALFEVEHSTPIYSGLLRLNDVHLMSPGSKATYSIASNEDRRAIFVKKLSRPTFVLSKLNESCNFLEYINVYFWHKRVIEQLREI